MVKRVHKVAFETRTIGLLVLTTYLCRFAPVGSGDPAGAQIDTNTKGGDYRILCLTERGGCV